MKRRSLKYSQKLFVGLLLILLIAIAYVVRGPLEIYAGNMHEFLFTLHDFLPWLLVMAVGIITLGGCLLAMLPDELFNIVSALLMWFGAASWIQDLVLNQVLIGMQGDRMDWADLGALPRNNFLIWCAILIVCLSLCIFSREKVAFDCQIHSRCRESAHVKESRAMVC